MKKIIASIFVSFPMLASATCTGSIPNNNINVSSSQIQYITNLSSSQIKNQIKSSNYSSTDVLGTFAADESIQTSTRIKYLSSGSNVCANIVDYNINFTLSPKIYIASEVRSSGCVTARVNDHEKEHYNRTMQSINEARNYAKSLIDKAAQVDFRGSSVQDINYQIKKVETDIQNAIISFMNKRYDELNSPLDTTENYQRESTFCPQREEMLVMSQIKRINGSF